MKRLFIAIKPEFNKKTIEHFYKIRENLKNEKIKWVDFSQIHITLKFLGDTTEAIIPSLNKNLKNISKNFSPFYLNFKGIGIFGNIKYPRVLWIGIDENLILKKLFIEIDNIVESFGFKKDTREFKPHLTLGRIKHINNRKNLASLITEKALTQFEQVEIDKFFLIESKLTKTGPIYTDLEVFNI